MKMLQKHQENYSEYSIKISKEMNIGLIFIIAINLVKTRLYIINVKSCFIVYNVHNKILLLVV